MFLLSATLAACACALTAAQTPPAVDCPAFCSFEYSPVCGSDGRRYSNLCEVNMAGCQCGGCVTRLDICSSTTCTVAGGGHVCADNPDTCDVTTCADWKRSHSPGLASEAAPPCPRFCTREYKPVCGSDGVTYGNLCTLQMTACNNGLTVKMVSAGPCPTKEAPPAVPVANYRAASIPPPISDPLLRRPESAASKPTAVPPPISVPLFARPVAASSKPQVIIDSLEDELGPAAAASIRSAASAKPTATPTAAEPTFIGLNVVRTPPPIIVDSLENEVGPEAASSIRAAASSRSAAASMATARATTTGGFGFLNVPKPTPITDGIEQLLGTSAAASIRSEISAPATKTPTPSQDGGFSMQSVGGSVACPDFCFMLLAPVCGSDGVTYANECEMRRKSCSTGTTITKTSEGICSAPAPTPTPASGGFAAAENSKPTPSSLLEPSRLQKARYVLCYKPYDCELQLGTNAVGWACVEPKSCPPQFCAVNAQWKPTACMRRRCTPAQRTKVVGYCRPSNLVSSTTPLA